MTERQKTGLWFIFTGILLLLIWVFAYAIVNSLLDSGFLSVNQSTLSGEQKYLLGASSVVTLQLVSLTGIPFVITGAAQFFLGAQATTKKTGKKK